MAKKGEIVGIACERYLRCKEGQVGTSVLRRIVRIPRIEEYTRRLVKEMAWDGIGHCDYMGRFESDQWHLLEFNARLWGAVGMTVQNGYDFPKALLLQSLGEAVGPECFTMPPRPREGIWLLGMGIAIVSNLAKGRLTEAASVVVELLRYGPKAVFDDFRFLDPLPFVFECIDYGRMFVLSGGRVNPG